MADDALFLGGSLCITDILEHLKKGHSAFTKSGKNQKVYMNFKQWVNPTPVEGDQYGNHSSIQLNAGEKASPEEKAQKLYIGNAVIRKRGGGEPVSANEGAAVAAGVQAVIDDLPF